VKKHVVTLCPLKEREAQAHTHVNDLELWAIETIGMAMDLHEGVWLRGVN
jgi:hypothetical protein